MKTIEQKAEEYIEPFRASLLGCETDLMKKAYLAGAKDALAGQWREIDDECKNVPDKDTVCLCRYMDGGYTVAIFDGVDVWQAPQTKEEFISPMWNVIDGDYVIGDEITHWMPIPEPPKPEEK